MSQDGSGYGVYGQRYNEDGDALGGEFRVNATTASDQLYSSVAALEGGGFIVTWQSYGQDGSFRGIYGQRYDANGGVVGDEFRINGTTRFSQFEPHAVGLDDGGFAVAWNGTGSGDGDGIFLKRFDTQGQGLRIIAGSDGDDNLRGGPLDDLLSGGEGDDILAGGPGDDVMTGGAGRDVFIIDALDGTDTVTDFQLGTVTGLVQFAASEGGNDHYYKLVQDPLTWQDARAAALGAGGYLATITSQAEQDFIINQVIAGQTTRPAWLGGSDAAAEGSWRWVDGSEAGQRLSAAGYENWGSNEPNNLGNEDAIEMHSNGRWNDIDVGVSRPYLVEFDTLSKDVLRLDGILDGVSADPDGAELDDYLQISSNGGDTEIAIDKEGGGHFASPDGTVVLEGVDLAVLGATQAEIIDALVGNGTLEVT